MSINVLWVEQHRIWIALSDVNVAAQFRCKLSTESGKWKAETTSLKEGVNYLENH